MTTLVTGGAGFIGHHLTRRLLERGDGVVVVDNLNDYGVGKLEKEDNVRVLKNEFQDRLGFIPWDIRDVNELKKIFLDYHVDKVVHLAALAGVRHSTDHPTEYADVNLAGMTSVLEASKGSVENFVYASSSSVYGERGGNFKEVSVLDRQESFYGLTKKLDEDIARFFSDQFGVNSTGLRFFTVYGPRSRPDMAHRMFSENLIKDEEINLFNNGENVRDYTFISDIVKGIILALDQPTTFGIYNLGGGEPVSTVRLYEGLSERLGLETKVNYVEPAEGDVTYTCADTTLAEISLGFKREVGFEEGLDKFCDWVKEHYGFNSVASRSNNDI